MNNRLGICMLSKCKYLHVEADHVQPSCLTDCKHINNMLAAGALAELVIVACLDSARQCCQIWAHLNQLPNGLARSCLPRCGL